MQYKTDLHYRWDDEDNLVVKKTGGKRVVFPKARDCYHSKGEVIVTTSTGHIVRLDKFMNKHW